MNETSKQRILIVEKIVVILLVLGSVLTTIKMIFWGYFIDESYHVCLSYRLSQGENIFGEVRDVYATTGILCALLLKLFFAITGGTEYIVLFLRACGVLIQMTISAVLYRTIKRKLSAYYAFIISLIYYNMYPKLTAIPEYSNMQQWFSVLMFCALFMAFDACHNRYYYVGIASVCYSMSVLAYPSQIILAPIILWGLSKIGCNTLKTQHVFWGGCFLLGFAFCTYLHVTVGLKDTISNVLFGILGDGHHLTGTNIIGESVFRSLISNILILLLYMVVVFLIALLIWGGILLYCKSKKCEIEKRFGFLASLVVASYMPSILFWIRGESYDTTKVYYIVAIIVAILIIYDNKYRKKEEKGLLLFFVICGTSNILAVSTVSNIPLVMNTVYLQVGMVVALACIAYFEPNKGTKYLLIFICSMSVFISGYLMKDSYYGSTILSMRRQVTSGPCKGLIINQDQAYIFESESMAIEKNINEGESVLIISNSLNIPTSTLYLIKNMVVSHYTTNSTLMYSPLLLDYWNEYQDKTPNIIAVDKSYGTHNNFSEDSWIFNYVMANYSLVNSTEYIDFYRRK